MNLEPLWKELTRILQSQGAEFLLETKYQPKHLNRIRMVDDENLKRLSDLSGSEWQTIPKKDVLWFAEEAIKSADSGFDIKETKERGGLLYVGSIICALLDLLPEFEYRKGQILVWVGQQAKA